MKQNRRNAPQRRDEVLRGAHRHARGRLAQHRGRSRRSPSSPASSRPDARPSTNRRAHAPGSTGRCPPPTPARRADSAQSAPAARSVGERRRGLLGRQHPETRAAHPAGSPGPDATTGCDDGRSARCQARNSSTSPRSARAPGSHARLQPPAQPRHLPQLVDRRERRIAAPPQLRPIRIRERSQRPRHQHPAHPARWPGHHSSLIREQGGARSTRTPALCRPLRRDHRPQSQIREPCRHNEQVGIIVIVPTSAQSRPAPHLRGAHAPRRLSRRR